MVVGDAFIQGTSLPARVTQKEPDDCSSIGSFSEVKEGPGRTYSLAYAAPAQSMIITIVIFLFSNNLLKNRYSQNSILPGLIPHPSPEIINAITIMSFNSHR